VQISTTIWAQIRAQSTPDPDRLAAHGSKWQAAAISNPGKAALWPAPADKWRQTRRKVLVRGHGLWPDLPAVRLPDRESESCPRRERLERILRCHFFVDVDADSGCFVDLHISLLHLWTAGKGFLNYLGPAEIHIFLNAEIRDGEIHVALGGVIDRIDVSRAVPASADTKGLGQAGDLQAGSNAADMVEPYPDEVDQSF
jgi:hypothetical protein